MDNEFIVEALDLLDSAEKSFMKYKPEMDFQDQYDEIYRVFHSIKGAAGMYSLKELQEHVHKIESQFEETYKNELMNSKAVDYFLSAIDLTREMLHGNVGGHFDYERIHDNTDLNPNVEPEVVTVVTKENANISLKDKEVEANTDVKKENRETTNQKKIGKVFIIDDEESVLEVLESILVDFDFQVKTFLDPDDLLKHLKKEVPDLILSDFSMPKMTGLELFAEVKKINKNLSFVLISGHITKKVLIDCHELGVSGILEKPAEPKNIASKCYEAVTRYRAMSTLDMAIKHMLSNFAEVDQYLAEKGKHSLRKSFKEDLEVIIEQRNKILNLG